MHTVLVSPDRHVLLPEPYIRMNHSFTPNAEVVIDDERGNISVVARTVGGEWGGGGAGGREGMLARSEEGNQEESGARVRNEKSVLITEGEEICFDYNTTEWELAVPFRDDASGRWVRGFRSLRHEDRAQLMQR